MDIRGTTWRKHGHDRTYLAAPDGRRLGWIDNRSGALTVEVEDFRADLEAWSSSHLPASQVPPPVDPSEDPGAAQVWEDLTTHRPGQAARERAEAELASMRSRSRIRTGIARALDLKTEERAWRVGAKGEESVGARLDRLADHGWRILHSIPIGQRGADIDHLLIGPGGVWTVNTKHHPGKRIWVSPRQIRVDGHPVPYLRNSVFEADRVRRILAETLGWEPFVKAALVILTGTLIPQVTIKQMPEDVLVLDRTDVPRAFKRMQDRLTPDGISEVFEASRRSTTWTR